MELEELKLKLEQSAKDNPKANTDQYRILSTIKIARSIPNLFIIIDRKYRLKEAKRYKDLISQIISSELS